MSTTTPQTTPQPETPTRLDHEPKVSPPAAEQVRAREAAAYGRSTDPEDSPRLGAPLTWADERVGAAKGLRFLLKKVFPDHWSFMLGEVAMYSMIICLITGTFLTFWFVPSAAHTTYDGTYAPMRGVPMSEAFKSTLDISFDVRGGLLIRQIHHWAALTFIAALMLHAARVFFTGAFRKPREINWVIGTVLALLAIVEGMTGYSLPDDLLSGTGIRATQGFILSIPVIGSWMSYLVFGSGFPGEDIIPRFFIAHVLLVPAILIGLFTVHLILVMVHKHTQYPGPGRTEKNVVGYPLMPVYIAKAGGFFFIVFGLIALISALFAINPVWQIGPYEPAQVTAGSQPDWYMWFADGALRLLPGWLEFTAFGTTYSMNIFLGSIVLLPLLYGAVGAYPFLEAWVTGDKREHHILDRPRNAPTRTAIGAAFITFYVVLALATVNDILAFKLKLSINDITNLFRILVFVLPVIIFIVTKRICLSLQRHDRELVLHGRESGRILRSASGEFAEAHEDLSEYDRWQLVSYETPELVSVGSGVDANGVAQGSGYGGPKAISSRRARASRFFYEDRVEAVTPADLAEAHGAHDAPHRSEHVVLPGAEASARAGVTHVAGGEQVTHDGQHVAPVLDGGRSSVAPPPVEEDADAQSARPLASAPSRSGTDPSRHGSAGVGPEHEPPVDRHAH